MSGSGIATAQGMPAKGQSALAHLIHALNQPLTGLQCSMELALSGRRPAEYYIRTLEEGLKLVSRMRLLAEGLRELADIRFIERQATAVQLDEVLREVAGELGPVAEKKNVRLDVAIPAQLTIEASRSHCATIFFRLLDAVLGLSREGSKLEILAAGEQGAVRIRVSWLGTRALQDSEFPGPAIGVLISQAELEQMGAVWRQVRNGDSHCCEIQLPLKSMSGPADAGGLR